MRDRVPELNNSVAQVMATEKLLAKNKERLETQVVDLDSKIRASVKMGRDDIATAYIGQLQQAQLDLQKTGQQLEHANLASKQALKARDNYVLQMQRRTAEAMQLINQSKQAKLQEQLAQTMESFELGDDRSTGVQRQPKQRCSWAPLRWTRRCRTSSVKRWTCSCRTGFSNTNATWGCWAREQAHQDRRLFRQKVRQPAAARMVLAVVPVEAMIFARNASIYIPR
jgi:hypothetical protein